MGEPKGHHFVPEVLLKHFVDGDGWLHFVRRDEPTAVRPTRINKAFKKSHLYTQLSDEGIKDTKTEKQLSALEHRADAVIGKILDAVRQDRLPALTTEELDVWYQFFVVQWKRVPDLHADIASDDMARRILQNVQDELRCLYPERKLEIAKFSQPNEIERTIRNTRVRSVLSISPRVTNLFRERGMRVVRLRVSGKAFVIGSRPVVQMGFGSGRTLFDRETEMWLPISSDVIVGMGSGSPIELLYFDTENPVRKLNEAIVAISSSFGCASPKLARSLAKSVWASS